MPSVLMSQSVQLPSAVLLGDKIQFESLNLES